MISCFKCGTPMEEPALWEAIDHLVEIYGTIDKVYETYKVIRLGAKER